MPVEPEDSSHTPLGALVLSVSPSTPARLERADRRFELYSFEPLVILNRRYEATSAREAMRRKFSYIRKPV